MLYIEKTVPFESPSVFRIVVHTFIVRTELFTVTPQGNGRVGWVVWPRIEEETILSRPWRFFLSPYRQPTCMEGGKSQRHTHTEKRENIRHSRPMLPGWAHTLSNSAFLTHISFSIFCGRLAAAAYCVYRSHVCGCCCLRALVTGPTAN